MGLRGEVLDFVNAYKTTSDTETKKKEAEDRGNYYEATAKTSARNADTAAAGQASRAEYMRGTLGLGRQRLGLSRDEFNFRKSQAVDPNDPALMPDPVPGVYSATPTTPVPSAPVAPGGSPSAVPMYDAGGAVGGDEDNEDDETPDTQHHNSGASTAAVSDDDDTSDETNDADVTDGGMTNPSAEILERWGLRAKKGEPNPVAIGLDSMTKKYGLNAPYQGVDDGRGGHPGAYKMMRGEEAMTDDELRAIDDKVDPNHKLAKSALSMARLDKLVNYWTDKGDMKKAATAAHALIVRGQLDSQKFGAAAAAAIQKGDMPAAVRFITRAYDNVPDGKRLEATVDQQGNVHGVTIDADGERQDLGAFGPQQVFQLARGVASGTDYYNRMAAIATGHLGEKQQGQGKAPASMKPNDAKIVDNAVDTEYDDMKLGIEDKTQNNTIKNVAKHIARAGQATPNEAATAAAQMAIPNTMEFSSKPVQGGMRVTFADGRRLVVPHDQFDQLAMIRTARMAKAKDAKEKADKPSFMEGLSRAVSRPGGDEPSGSNTKSFEELAASP
jgi:hypothetical protein